MRIIAAEVRHGQSRTTVVKVLVANYRYFVSGGPERHLFDVTEALGRRGHEIVPFSIRYTRNQPTPYARYFVEPLGSADEIRFGDQRATPRALLRTLTRLFYATDVERAVRNLVSETQPSVAYVLHFLRKLSPSLLVALKQAGIPIVVRLSDYGMLCPEQHCVRDGLPCERCLGGSLLPSVRYGCVQGSRVASGLNAVATWYHRWRRYFDLIDVFVTTNQFMYRKMRAADVPEERLRCIPTAVDGTRFRPDDAIKEADVVYGGRLEAIKGVHVLLEACAILRDQRPGLPLRVKIAGEGDAQYTTRLRALALDLNLGGTVEFVGTLDVPRLSGLLARARLSVVPSIWYENLPNAALESYACGTPVIASDHGALTECVREGETGYRFRPGDKADLARVLARALEDPARLEAMGRTARHDADTTYSPAVHIASLERLFSDVVRRNAPSRGAASPSA